MLVRPEELRYAVRRLVRSPGFTLVAVLSLALGIGANTAMFSVVNAVLLRQLPVTEPGQLVELYTAESNGYAYATSSYPDFLDMRGLTDVFSGVVGTRTFLARVEQEGGQPGMAFGELVSWDYFQVLGVRMHLGRTFLPEEDVAPGTHPVVILGYRTWTRDYGADPGIVGRTLRLGGSPHTVIGVLPEEFTGSMPVLVTGFYAPLVMTDLLMGNSLDGQLDRRGSRSMFVKARLRPGVTVEQADQAMKALAAGLAEAHPDSNEGRTMSALPSGDVALHPAVDRALKPVAALLLAAVGLVLLIACANLASFLLARAEDRRREVAVRLALGAGRGALVRQLLTETTLLALLGGAAGVLIARWTLDLVMAFQPPLPIPVDLDVSLDRNVLGFTALVSLAAGLFFGLVPALQATNPDLAPTLKDGTDRGRGPGRFTLRNGLVVLQVTFSFVLLIGAGLFVRSFQKAQQIDPGFHSGPGAILWPMASMSGIESEEERELFAARAQEALLAHPLITHLAMADRLPLGAGVQTASYRLPGVASERPDGETEVDNARVSPSYFETLGVQILRGRGFTRDDEGGEGVVVVSQAFLDRYYPGQDVLGMLIDEGTPRPKRIIGVAADTKVRTLGEAPRPYVYERLGGGDGGDSQFLVRGTGESAGILAAARGVLDAIEPDLVYFETKTLEEHFALMLFAPRMAAALLGVFGGLALLLSAVGIYGVVSYAVARRTRELGIRISLGATARNVVGLAVGGGMRLVAVGGVLGMVMAAAMTWLLGRFLYGIGPTDLVTFASIPVLLAAVALVAALIPARRASAVDPVRALRAE